MSGDRCGCSVQLVLNVECSVELGCWQQPRRARSAAGPMKKSPLSTHILPVDNRVVMEVRLEAAQAHRRVDVATQGATHIVALYVDSRVCCS